MRKWDRSGRNQEQEHDCQHKASSGVSDGLARQGDANGPRRDESLVVEFFQDGRGIPFERWYATLPARTQTWIDSKIHRLAKSHSLLLSGTKPVGGGLRELRHLGAGPGYRVYLAVIRNRLIILGGGDKSRQTKDVQDARRRLRNLRHREGGHAQADHRPNGRQS